MTYKVAGSIRFNTATSKMEIYNGEQWWQIDSTSPSEETGGTRGLFYGGNTSPSSNRDRIEFINVGSSGNSIDFGNLLAAQGEGGGDRGGRAARARPSRGAGAQRARQRHSGAGPVRVARGGVLTPAVRR